VCNGRALVSFLVSLLLFVSTSLHAAEQDDAEKAAKEILASLANQSFQMLWDTQTSKLFKDKITKDSFLANMSLGRAQLGKLSESKLIDSAFSESDPPTGFKGPSMPSIS
jgi:hypothetical protein